MFLLVLFFFSLATYPGVLPPHQSLPPPLSPSAPSIHIHPPASPEALHRSPSILNIHPPRLLHSPSAFLLISWCSTSSSLYSPRKYHAFQRVSCIPYICICMYIRACTRALYASRHCATMLSHPCFRNDMQAAGGLAGPPRSYPHACRPDKF